MVTIAIVTACVGKPYHEFLPKWINGVCKLERKPDEIVVATDLIEQEIWLPDGLVKYVPAPTESKSGHWAFAVNEAIAATTADWVCKVDVDDIILPHALNEVDSCEADVYCFGIEIDGNPRHANPENILEQDDPQIFSNAVYRRWVWEKNPYEDMYCEDALFWYSAAHEGATFAVSQNVDYIYGRHPNQVTASLDTSRALAEVQRLRQERFGGP